MDPPRRGPRRAPGVVPGDDADRVPGRGPGAAPRRSWTPRFPCLPTWRGDSPPKGWAGSPWYIGYLGRETGLAPRAGQPVSGARTAGARCSVRRRGGGHLGQAPPAQLRGVRRGPLLRPGRPFPYCGCTGIDVGSCHLRGPLAGRRTGRGGGQSRRGLLLCINALARTSAARTTRGWHWCAARGGSRCRLAYVNMVGGQDELVFDGDSDRSSTTGGDILARAPQFAETLLVRRPGPPGRPTAIHRAPADACDGTRSRSTAWRFRPLRQRPRGARRATQHRPARPRSPRSTPPWSPALGTT